MSYWIYIGIYSYIKLYLSEPGLQDFQDKKSRPGGRSYRI